MKHSRIVSLPSWIALFVVLVLPAIGSAQSQMFPKPPATGGNYVIAVISDGFTNDEAYAFDRAVKGLLLNGLLADPFYSDHSTAFTIYKFFKPVAQSQQSSFGITPNYDVGKCYIDYDANTTTTAIEAAVSAVTPRRIVVIGNYEGVSLGCTVDTWSYVSSGAREAGGILEHEFGHLIAGLDDEYVLLPASYPGPAVDGPNCSTETNPIWKGGVFTDPPTDPPGCRFYGSGIVRPYDNCRMRSPYTSFCPVCSSEMATELKTFEPGASGQSLVVQRLPVMLAGIGGQPSRAQPSQAADRSVRMLVRITKPDASSTTGATAVIVSATDVTAPIVPQHRRTGDYVYAIVQGNTVLASEVLPGNPFQQRAYASTPAPHRANDDPITAKAPTTATIAVLIPRLTREQLKTGTVEIVFYWLDPLFGRNKDGTKEPITPARVTEFLQASRPQLTRITGDELKKAIERLQ